MRPTSRRCPPGQAEEPNPPHANLAVLRIGANRGLLDHPPWQPRLADVAILWTDPATGPWRYVEWPRDEIGRFIAPLDLCVGHVLAFIAPDNHTVYTWVADISTTSIAVVASQSAEVAHRSGAAAAMLWLEEQADMVRSGWRRRLEAVAR